MPIEDHQRWDDKYRRGEHLSEKPSALIASLDPMLPREGYGLDVAGGGGRHAIWLAQRGLVMTLADISQVALTVAQQRATALDIELTTLHVDLERQLFPSGPWDLILNVHFLWRPLFREFVKQLAPGGHLVFLQPTRSNLQRHRKPSEGYLLEDGELRTLLHGLEIVHYEEGWLREGRHEVLLVAKRAANAPQR